MREQAEQSPATGRACCTVCIPDGRTNMVLQWMCWIIWMAMRRASSPLPSRLTEKMPTAISNPKRVFTDWSVSHRSMRLERDRPRLYPAMSCRILRKTSISRSGMKICVSILTVPAEPAVSTSTRPPRRSVSPICRPTSLFSARMSVPST